MLVALEIGSNATGGSHLAYLEALQRLHRSSGISEAVTEDDVGGDGRLEQKCSAHELGADIRGVRVNGTAAKSAGLLSNWVGML